MNYLLILSIGFIIFGICFIITYLKEKYSKYLIIKGKIIDIRKSNSQNNKYIGYTPIIEYQYNNQKYQIEHRITSPKVSSKYRVNDIIELRAYKDKTNKAIINDRLNILMPIIAGISVIIIGIIILLIWFCFI